MEQLGITRGAAIAINDFLDNCAEIKPGDEVVLAAHIDGAQGGDNLVDPQAIAWIQAAIQARDANPTVMWIDEPFHIHQWRVPPVFMAALKACNVFINHSFDLTIEELKSIQEAATEHNVTLCRNFATTPGLLNSPWAQTPYELVSEIRYQACVPFGGGNVPFELKDEHGTCLEGTVAPPNHPRFPTYTRRRNEGPGYRPFPEWIFPPINIRDTSGTVVFDRMLAWWARYIGISPYFDNPIKLSIENNIITKIEGGREAEAMESFLSEMKERLGEGVYGVNTFHYGINPQATMRKDQCPNKLIRSYIDHSNSCNFHIHIGKPPATEKYPYVLHCTADIRKPTLRVGDALVYDNGHLTTLENPEVLKVAAKYPDRPGLPAKTESCNL
jgi:hypothetical protein